MRYNHMKRVYEVSNNVFQFSNQKNIKKCMQHQDLVIQVENNLTVIRMQAEVGISEQNQISIDDTIDIYKEP